MLLDLTKQFEINKAETKLQQLIKKGAKIELTEKRYKTSIKQNAYEHVLFSLFAIEFGYTESEVKQHIFKKEVNKELFKTEFVNKQTGNISIDWRSVRDLNTKETTLAIDRFRNYSSMNGLYLPTSEEYIEQRFYIDKEINKHKEFL
jgi:hypothetical protein